MNLIAFTQWPSNRTNYNGKKVYYLEPNSSKNRNYKFTLKYDFEYFHIDVTFEIRTSEYVEMCISIDDQNNRREGFYVKRKEGEREQGSGETERERACVCVCVR